MRRSIGLCAFAAAIAFPASAWADWTKSYVIEWNEPAMYYGAKEGVTEPGTDCPKGTNPEFNWEKIMVQAGYTPLEAKWLRDPANPTRSPVNGQNQMAFRGKDRANVYTDPTSTPDPGLVGVTGPTTEGVNLDDNEKTGFPGPNGEKGVDNAFYRTLGCWKTYRAPQRLSSGALQFNDSMRNGGWTTVIVVTGKGADPMNDNNVKVGFYFSADKMVKDGNGNVARDYTFSIKPHAKYEALFDARTKDGAIISTKPSDEVMIRDASYTQDLDLLKAQINLKMQKDGTLKGYLGGYRPWEPVYKGWVNARGPVIESLTWVQLPSVYYALKRNADYAPTPGGEKTHISYAMRIEALPAFVMTPDATKEATEVVSYKAQASPETAKPQLFTVWDAGGVIPDRTAKVQASPTTPITPPAGYAVAGGQ